MFYKVYESIAHHVCGRALTMDQIWNMFLLTVIFQNYTEANQENLIGLHFLSLF